MRPQQKIYRSAIIDSSRWAAYNHRPGVSTSGRVIYQVAPDATGFKLTVDDVEFWEDKSAVFNLSNIRPRAY
jgi:hypothetical protein